MSKALLVVDMQNMPFIWKEYGGKTLFNEDIVLKNTKELIESARINDVKIFYIMFTENENSMRKEGSDLWLVHKELSPKESDEIIVKYYADSFYRTDLEEKLKNDRIKDIVICGLQTEFCIDTSVKSAFSKGFNIELAKDCHTTFDSDVLKAKDIIDHHNLSLKQFCQLVKSKDIKW